MDVYQLGVIVGYILGVILGLVLQYFLIKYAVYAGIKKYKDNQVYDREYETIRDAVQAGMQSFDEFKKEVKKGKI